MTDLDCNMKIIGALSIMIDCLSDLENSLYNCDAQQLQQQMDVVLQNLCKIRDDYIKEVI